MSTGADDELIVLSALEDRDDAARILTHIFSDTLYTPAPEPYYKAKYVKPEEIAKIRLHPNLVVISINDDLTNPGTRLVKDMLTPTSYIKSKSGIPFILSKDTYAKFQTILVINGNSTDSVIQYTKIHGQKIHQQFEEQFFQRQNKFLFEKASKKDMEKYMMEKYGFGFQIPWGFSVVKDSAAAQLFWIGREDPFRWLVSHWVNQREIISIDEAESFFKTTPEKLFNNIQFSDYQFTIKPYIFNDRAGWKISGLWEEVKEAQGGPFIAYMFYDCTTSKTFYILALIYNPGEDKYILLRQLDLIARTFHTAGNS